MRLLGRKERPPAGALAGLDRDERVVSWAGTGDTDGAGAGAGSTAGDAGTEGAGGTVVATPLGLWLPGATERLPWHLVIKATWRENVLTVIPAVDTGDGVLEPQPPRSVRLTHPRDLPQTVRVRVQRGISFTRHHPLPDGGGVRVVGRRVPGRDGVSWQRVFDAGVDRDAPAVRAATAAYVEAARVELGI